MQHTQHQAPKTVKSSDQHRHLHRHQTLPRATPCLLLCMLHILVSGRTAQREWRVCSHQLPRRVGLVLAYS
jgi:hypothetical protein